METANLTDWQLRVLAEKRELSLKIDKLWVFLKEQESKRTIDLDVLKMLKRQHWAMSLYEACLEDRIEQF